VIIEFINSNDFSYKKIGLFGTSGSGKGSELEWMRMVLESQGSRLQGEYTCKGKTFFLLTGNIQQMMRLVRLKNSLEILYKNN